MQHAKVLVPLLLLLLALTVNPVVAAPGDRGSVLGRAFRIGDIIPIGSWSCCGSGFALDVGVCRITGDSILYVPRVVLTSSDGGPPEYLLFDLQGFEGLLKAAESVDVTPDAKDGEPTITGTVYTMLPLMNDGLLRAVTVLRVGGGSDMPRGMILSQHPDSGDVFLGVGWHLSPQPGHSGWPDVLRLLRRVQPAVDSDYDVRIGR